jgi:hypothetical protein
MRIGALDAQIGRRVSGLPQDHRWTSSQNAPGIRQPDSSTGLVSSLLIVYRMVTGAAATASRA